jgi:hypothetical protein
MKIIAGGVKNSSSCLGKPRLLSSPHRIWKQRKHVRVIADRLQRYHDVRRVLEPQGSGGLEQTLERQRDERMSVSGMSG